MRDFPLGRKVAYSYKCPGCSTGLAYQVANDKGHAIANSSLRTVLCQRSKLHRLFDHLDAAAVDGAAPSAPGAEERDQVQQEPDGDALVLVYPKVDEDAGYIS